MNSKKAKDVASFFKIEKNLLPIGCSDWFVEKIEYNPEDEVLRKVTSNFHQTSQFLVCTFNKPITQLTTTEE